MRILIFNWRDVTHPWAGGGEVNIHEQAKRWAAWGHSVTMLCSRYPRHLPCESETAVDGVRVIRRGGRFSVYLRVAWYYLRHLRGQFDVVVDVANGVPFFTPLYCRLPKVILFHHVHRKQWFIEFPWPAAFLGWCLERWLVRLLYRHAQPVAISDSTVSDLGRVGFDGGRAVKVEPGLDHEGYAPASEAPDPNVLIHVGRVKRYKRLDVLIDLVKRLSVEHPDVQLHLVGAGEETGNLRALATREGVADRVVFHGRVSHEEKRRLLQQAYLFLTASLHEGWGLTILEANACGVPAVAFDAPGLRDSIRPGATGVLVQSQDELAGQVARLLSDRALRDELAQGALAWASRFSWDGAAQRLLLQIERVAEAHRDERVPALGK